MKSNWKYTTHSFRFRSENFRLKNFRDIYDVNFLKPKVRILGENSLYLESNNFHGGLFCLFLYGNE